MPNPTISLKPPIGADPASLAIPIPSSLRAQRNNPVYGTAGLPRCARNDRKGKSAGLTPSKGLLAPLPLLQNRSCRGLRRASRSPTLSLQSSHRVLGSVRQPLAQIAKPRRKLTSTVHQRPICDLGKWQQHLRLTGKYGPFGVHLPLTRHEHETPQEQWLKTITCGNLQLPIAPLGVMAPVGLTRSKHLCRQQSFVVKTGKAGWAIGQFGKIETGPASFIKHLSDRLTLRALLWPDSVKNQSASLLFHRTTIGRCSLMKPTLSFLWNVTESQTSHDISPMIAMQSMYAMKAL